MDTNHFLNQGHLYCRKDGRKVAVHRLVVEEHIGRALTRDEIIHHRDHDPENNAIENLQIMTRAEHCRHHLRDAPLSKWTPEEEAEMLRLRREGNTIDVIAAALGKGYYPVRRRLARATKLGVL
jgi:HNH endonuclease